METKYQRKAPVVSKKRVSDIKLRNILKKQGDLVNTATRELKQAEILLPSEPGTLQPSLVNGIDATFRYSQQAIKQYVDYRAQQLQWNLDLEQVKFGSYQSLSVTPNGRHVLFASKKGHIVSFDQIDRKLQQEMYLKDGTQTELIKDSTWLHNELFFAIAQRDYVYIYDHTGMELHCLRNHLETNKLEFLRYHFLLASVGNAGILRYEDTSTGALVAELKTRLGRCNVMSQNPQNAILHLGHNSGTVTLWSPNVPQQLVKMLCHKGPVNAVSIDQSGTYMSTAGMDGQLKIWDLRTYKQLYQLYTPTPVNHMCYSQRGLLAAAHGPRVSIYKEFTGKPYMTHLQGGSLINQMTFTPHQDTLVYAHIKGIASILVPGSSDPNFDSFEANPFQTAKQRQESEVKMLLEKIQPDMITLNLDSGQAGTVDAGRIGVISQEHGEVIKQERQIAALANNTKDEPDRHRAKGKSSTIKRHLRKQKNIFDAKKLMYQEQLAKQNQPVEVQEAPTVFTRFNKRPQK